ncbi:MAG TPA: CPBP family intramembrane metalloprotease [Clostridiaceae bacterium]|nr:CPBP family intramembrane metalloprotease [Clostridiaceae bacterium]
MTRSPDLNGGNKIVPFPVTRKEDHDGQTDIRKPTIIPQVPKKNNGRPDIRTPSVRPVTAPRQTTRPISPAERQAEGNMGHRSTHQQAQKMETKKQKRRQTASPKKSAGVVKNEIRKPKLRNISTEQPTAKGNKTNRRSDSAATTGKGGTGLTTPSKISTGDKKGVPLSLLIKDATGLASLILAAVIFCMQLFWPHLPLFNWGLSSGGLTNYVLYNLIYFTFGVFLPIFLFTRIYRIDPTHIMGSGRTNRQIVFQSLLTGVIAGIFLRGLHNVLFYALIRNGVIIKEHIVPVYPDIQHPIGVIPVIFFSILLPTILDELLFRGIIQTGLSQGGHALWGILGSALLFMLAQQQSLVWVVPLGIALLTARIRYIYDDIKPAMVLHCAMRSVLALLYFIIPRFDSNHILLHLTHNKAQFYISLFAVLIAGVALWFQWSDMEKRSPYGSRPKRVVRSQTYVQPLHPIMRNETSSIWRSLPWGYIAAIFIMCMGMLLQTAE